MPLREVLAANLRHYRAERGWSQEELAHRAGIDRTYVSAHERCLYAATIDVLEKLAIELGVEAAELIRSAMNRRPNRVLSQMADETASAAASLA